jgi:uncharacterized coiled-coil protein SlyX
MRIDIFLHEADTELLTEISKQLTHLIERVMHMAGELDDLATQVQKNTDVEASAVTVLNQLKALLDAAGTDPVKLKALSDQLGTSADSLAAAIANDTPPPTP